MRAVVALLGTGRGHGRRLLLAALLGAVTYASAVALMGFAAWLISRAAEHPAASTLTLAAVAVRALGLTRGLARYAERLVGHDATLKAVADLRVAVFQGLVQRPDTALRSGESLSGVVVDVEAVQDLWLRCALPLTAAFVVAGASVAACWWWLPQAGAALLVGLVVALIATPVLGAVAARTERTLADQRADYQVKTLDVVHGCADLLVLGELPVALETARRSAAELAQQDRRTAWRLALVSAVTTGLHGVTVLAVAVVSLPAVQSGALSRVGLAVVVLVALASFEPVLPLADAGALLPRTLGAARRLADLLVDEPGPRPDIGGVGDSLHVRGLVASYPQAPEPAVRQIDLDLVPGRSLAVVGASGAGKSSLLRVLVGQLDAEQGTVRLGEVDLACLSPEALSHHVVLAEQDAHVFDASLRDNLRIGCPGATDAELWAVADVVGLRALVEGLPHGWDTPTGERGAQLSGGERKRLSVARALLSDAPVLLLDEPTEGLAQQDADELVRRVLLAGQDRALLLVTHRVAALDDVDEVLVLDDGRVVQRGAPGQLRQEPGSCRDLWSANDDTVASAR